MPAHIYGRRCGMNAINKLAKDYNLSVIEDSAEAHGTPLDSDIACFSLFGNKIITAGEGGICVTNSEKLSWQIRHLSSMAFDEVHNFVHKKIAYNYRMTNMQGAVALAQLERMDEFLSKREQIEKWYNEGLTGLRQITIMPKRHSVWYYDLLAERRDRLMDFLELQGIETRMYFKPMSMQPMYFDANYTKLKAWEYAQKGLYLPTYFSLTKNDVDYIIQVIRQFYSSV